METQIKDSKPVDTYIMEKTMEDGHHAECLPHQPHEPLNLSVSPSTPSIESQTPATSRRDHSTLHYLVLTNPFHILGMNLVLLVLIELIGLAYEIFGPQPPSQYISHVVTRVECFFHLPSIQFVIWVWMFFSNSRKFGSVAELMEETRKHRYTAWVVLVLTWVHLVWQVWRDDGCWCGRS